MAALSFLMAHSCLVLSPVNVATRGRSTLLPNRIAEADYRIHDSQCKALKYVLKRKGCLKQIISKKDDVKKERISRSLVFEERYIWRGTFYVLACDRISLLLGMEIPGRPLSCKPEKPYFVSFRLGHEINICTVVGWWLLTIEP
jgi:hypothetical protein